MSRYYLSLELRNLVARRADYLCEYCLISETVRSTSHQFDHIISIKHGGNTSAENLAYACLYCNLNKGTDLGSISRQSGELTRFFNPRTDKWSDHFFLRDARIEPLTNLGEVTVRILKLNDQDRILERQLLIYVNQYPSPEAKKRINSDDGKSPSK